MTIETTTDASTPELSRTSWAAWPAAASAVLALALYAVTLGGTYIYDDGYLIGRDERIRSVHQWKELWTKDYFNGGIDNLYRPLVSQSFAIQWWIHGNKPWAFHLVNVLLHAAAAAAVAELARRLSGLKAAWIAGLLFAAHPIHVEAVAGIVGRCEEACTLAVAGALILFLKRPLTPARAIAIGLCTIAAILSKEQGLLMPAFLLALAWAIRWRPASETEKLAVQIVALFACFSVAGLIVLKEEILPLKFEWDPVFLDETINPIARSGRVDHVLMVFVLIGRYARLLFAPTHLSIDYGTSVMTSVADRHDPYLYAGFAIVAIAIIALIIAIMKRDRVAIFCLIGLGLSYAMASNIILIGTIMGERLMYLPSMFLLIYLATIVSRWRIRIVIPVLALLVSLASWRTVTSAARWNDSVRFYTISLAEQPRSVRIHLLLASSLEKIGDLDGAERVVASGREVAPDYWNVWAYSGQLAENRGRYSEALAYYKKAWDLKPNVGLDNKIARMNAFLAATRPAASRP